MKDTKDLLHHRPKKVENKHIYQKMSQASMQKTGTDYFVPSIISNRSIRPEHPFSYKTLLPYNAIKEMMEVIPIKMIVTESVIECL